ncbi:LuxR C-terminal-related transcriptional regulator [Nocardia sp. NPDC051832]|uniref:LuxR C-terminal-related transcriptional regulator n=1 Tax=Nocardia sp. NPDC051832 TaxID=3155673 RepID=UPI00341EAF65
MPDIAFDTMPCARDIFRELDSAAARRNAHAPAVHLIRGRSGTGKSTLLAAIRARLHEQGIPLCDTVCHPCPESDPAGPRPALLIDNAHTLGADDLQSLCEIIESGRCTIVVAVQPRPHDPYLRALTDAVARRGRVLDLRPLGVADIGPFARELGMTVPLHVAQHIHQHTGGIRGGVVTALAAACSARLDAGIPAVDLAVTHWARTLLDDLAPDLLETLAVATTGTGLDSSELTEVLGVEPAAAQALIDRARATALVTDADLLLAPAIAPLRTLLGDHRYLAVQRRLFTARLDAGLLRDHTALLLAESGVRDQQLAEFLCAAAEHAGREAVRYYAAAAAAGADPDQMALRWAEAAAQTGDGETAMRLAEPMLARSGITGTDLADAVRICAAVLTRRGLVGRAAQLYTWLGPDRTAADWAVGATVHYLAGNIATATKLAESAPNWPPTEASTQARLIAVALADTLAESDSESRTSGAVSALVQAADSGPGADVFLPCTAVSIAALLCLSTGAPQRAADALQRATAGGLRCHQLQVLSAWTSLLDGDEQGAAATAGALTWDRLDIRDQLLAHGVVVGLARRAGDHAALTRAWQAACPLFDAVDADLLTMLPIGELWTAGVLLHEERRIAPLVEAAQALLRRVHQPSGWANVFHWYAVQAAIAAHNPERLLAAARPLDTAAAAGDRHAAALALAARTWIAVLRKQIVATRVEAAVAGLRGFGLAREAAQLAAASATAAAADAVTSAALGELARNARAELRPQQLPVPAPGPAAGAKPAPAAEAEAVLSEREREVAELVLLGLTYREIGARLYISAKTVEHHVARIRRRIGATSRSELLSMLRAMGCAAHQQGSLPV